MASKTHILEPRKSNVYHHKTCIQDKSQTENDREKEQTMAFNKICITTSTVKNGQMVP